jgi:hypothetical protein
MKEKRQDREGESRDRQEDKTQSQFLRSKNLKELISKMMMK